MSWVKDRASYRKIRNELIDIIGREPDDFRYQPDPDRSPSWTYWKAEEGEPDCIVGRLLFKLGVSGEDLNSIDRDVQSDAGIWELYRNGRFRDRFTEPVAKMLSVVQNRQDAGALWSELPAAMDAWWDGYQYATQNAGGDSSGDV